MQSAQINENKVIKMKKILKEKSPKFLTYGRSAHHLNLLVKSTQIFQKSTFTSSKQLEIS